MTKEIKATPSEELQPRKTYASPQLVIYGNISRITQATTGLGKDDKASGKLKT